MDKLPDNLHAVMALFMQDDKVRDVSFAESMHAIDDIRQLHKLGLLEDPDKQWGRYIGITEEGEDYRRAFFPTKDEQIADLRAATTDTAIQDVIRNADENAHKKPNMRTLWEEISEATLSWRGKHEHPLRLELMQVAGICINMIRQIDAGEEFKP